MREILFRGFGIQSRMWHEGEIINTTGTIPPYMPMILVPNEKNDGCAYDVYPESVGQFTGLFDKNGKKIFEGDIVKAKRICNGNLWMGCVAWRNGCFAIQGLKDGNNVPAIELFNHYEVIGNIHDNPELLQ